MRYKKPRTATLDEVIISREGEYAVIEFREPGISTMNLKLGSKVKTMTDRQILNAMARHDFWMERTKLNTLPGRNKRLRMAGASVSESNRLQFHYVLSL